MSPPHPLPTWLLAQLPVRGTAAFVLAPTRAAARALRHELAPALPGLLGVHFGTGSDLARLLLRLTGNPVAAPGPDPLLLRSALRSQLDAIEAPFARYARRFPQALEHLLRTLQEIQDSGGRRAGAELSAEGELLAQLAMRFEPAGAATRYQLVQAAMGLATPRGGWPRILVVPGAGLDGAIELLLARLAALGAEIARWQAPVSQPQLALRSTATIQHELRLAAHGCMQAYRAGVAFARMAVAAPALGPYVPYLRAAFAAEGVPFASEAQSPLAQEPRGALCVHAARVFYGEASRRDWLALLGSAHRRTPLEPARIEAFDRDSRRHGWKHRGAAAGEFAAAVPPLPAAGTRSARLLAFLESWLGDPDPAQRDGRAAERLGACLDVLAAYERVETLDDAAFCAELERMLGNRGLELSSGHADAVLVLEHEQVLAHATEHLHVLGMSAAFLPGPGPSELFLRDPDRRAFAGMACAESARARERGLLEQLLAHATRSTILSFARADMQGRETGPSLLLEELAGLPELVAEPAHPESLATLRVASGLCAPDLGRTLLLLRSSDPPGAAPWLVRARRLEDFTSTHLGHDGWIGTPDAREALNVTEVEELARCAEAWLWRHPCGIEPLEPEPDPAALPRDRIGRMVHKALEAAYRAHLAEFAADPLPEDLGARLQRDAASRFEAELAADASALRREFPAVFRVVAAQWQQALAAAIDHDLARMRSDGSRPRDVERKLEGHLAMPLRGRIDRIDLLPGGQLRIVDFKTGGTGIDRVKQRPILSGQHCQLLLYAHLAGAAHVDELEVQIVRPGLDPGTETFHSIDAQPLLTGEVAQRFATTMQVLAQLRATGFYPRNPEQGDCEWCEFRIACRRLHPPSRERVARAPQAASYLGLDAAAMDKSKRSRG